MEFIYQARDDKGVMKTGNIEAASEAAAYEVLQQKGLIIIKIQTTSSISVLERVAIFESVSPKEIVLFSRQLSTLISAKVPIVQALRVLQLQVSSNKLKMIISDVAEKVESGDSLSSALALYPKYFSNLYVNLTKAGELSGSLDESLSYLANQLEKDYDLRSKIIGSMTYPIFIVFAILVVGIVMFLKVLPPLVGILQESQVELPGTTKILIATTNLMQNYWWLMIGGTIGLIIGFRAYKATESGAYMIDKLKTKLPIFGKLYLRIYMSRFTRNLSTLIGGGIPIVKALDTVADIVGNKVYREIIMDAGKQVRNGKSIASAFANRKEIPPIVSQMTQIGESTGKLKDILERLAMFYEKEVEAMLQILTTLIEPIIMVLLGLAVAVMVAGILLPIYNLAGAA
jgi:type IV pilus assembly protein PilC